MYSTSETACVNCAWHTTKAVGHSWIHQFRAQQTVSLFWVLLLSWEGEQIIWASFYLPEILHRWEVSESGGVSSRQWCVQEKLRHDFGVVVHIGTHHPIGHCRANHNITWSNIPLNNSYIQMKAGESTLYGSFADNNTLLTSSMALQQLDKQEK